MRFAILMGFTAIFLFKAPSISQSESPDIDNNGSIPIVAKRLYSSNVEKAQQQQPITVRFCDLIARPDSFNGKIVRVQAIYESTWEWRRLYDETCLGPQNYIWPVFECDTIETCEIFRKSLEKDMVGNPFKGQKVQVTLVGRFRGHHQSRQRYGVQGGLQFQLEIVRIEETKRVSTKNS